VGVWLFLLCLILTVWNPASLALRLAGAASSLTSQPTVTLVSLVVRLGVTSIGVSAGIALFLRRPRAVQLTKIALVLFASEAVIRLSTRIGLSEAPPGTRLPLAIFVAAHNAAWYLYLHKSRHVRAIYGLESHTNP